MNYLRQCWHCRRELGELEDCYIVKRDTKPGSPPGTPHRWARVGVACCRCIEHDGRPLAVEVKPTKENQ